MRWPAEQVAKQNPDWRILNLPFSAEERYDWGLEADLLVLIQNSDIDFLPVIEMRRKLGRKTLVEYNDNFYEPQPWSPAAAATGR